MKGLHYEDCSNDVKRQASLAKQYVEDYLKDALVGFYLHGSIALGAFYEGRSDLDMLIVVNRELTKEERYQLMYAFLLLHKKPIPIEASIVLQQDLQSWKHPLPYQFHFSDYWRKHYAEMAYWEDNRFWDFETERTDIDLACHVSVARQVGIALYGPAPETILPVVPEVDFWHSIASEADTLMALQPAQKSEEAAAGHNDNEWTFDASDAYGVLTLLRIWSYRELGILYSKSAAALWASEIRLPQHLRYIPLSALDAYLGATPSFHCQMENWIELRAFLLNACPIAKTA
ncbi:aminoglycoside adenylyltransferase domain-containing protein [Paenibacillus sp. GCM10027627]|uniref:aminoglycoside adenylyltransferase domain-containing protein n=1 Tax=unclassified Paenibacillus TaxID=185978 RepID=UPI0036454056